MKKVLFVCSGNSCRSQMAEGFLLAYGKDVLEVSSAGTSASGIVNRAAAEAMKQKGIDITNQSSDQLTDDMVASSDVVITMGCCAAKDLCPPDFKGSMRDWLVADPLGKPSEVMESVRDDIESRVRELIEEFKVASN